MPGSMDDDFLDRSETKNNLPFPSTRRSVNWSSLDIKPTEADLATSQTLREGGVNLSPEEVAFNKNWNRAGWAPTEGRGTLLVERLERDGKEVVMLGNETQGWTIYLKKPSEAGS